VSENRFARNLGEEIFSVASRRLTEDGGPHFEFFSKSPRFTRSFRNRPASEIISEIISELNRSGKIDQLKICFLACTT